MSKHTPGPWLIDENDMYGEVGITTQKRIDESMVSIAEVSVDFVDEGFDNEQRANARLIASAPELLEALKNLLAVMNGDGGTGPNAQETARQAIAKAEGK